jgi:hypothetical protein
LTNSEEGQLGQVPTKEFDQAIIQANSDHAWLVVIFKKQRPHCFALSMVLINFLIVYLSS